MLIYLSLLDGEAEKRKFERLYLDYRQTMYYIAYHILKHRSGAEDAVHQAFMRVIDHLDQIDENDYRKTRGFLVTVTEHIAIDMYRKRKKEHTLSYEELEYSVADTAGAGSTREVWQAIDLLPLNYSTVLRLKFSHGYTNEEIAEILHITEENVRQRISRARKKLAEILEEEAK